MACERARWHCVLLCVCSLLAAAAGAAAGAGGAAGGAAGRRRKRLSGQIDNSKLIQNIKDKLVVDNEDYLPEGSPEAELNFVIGKAKVQMTGSIAEPETARFDFRIGHVERVPEKEPQKKAKQGTTRREAKLAMRLREKPKKNNKIKTTKDVPSTAAGEMWDPYTAEIEKSKRVKFPPREDVPLTSKQWVVTETNKPWTPLHLINVDPGGGVASSIVVYNFYPITQPKKRADIEGRIGRTRTSRGVTSSSPSPSLPPDILVRKAMSLSEVGTGRMAQLMDGASSRARTADDASVHVRVEGEGEGEGEGKGEPPSGLVTFRYRADIPVEVPLSRRWIANAFSY